jgi:hypothetical protein
MAKSASIAKMSHRHEAILNYMIMNPTHPLSLVAGHFEVSQPWLSTIIHSHAFQDQLARRKDEFFEVAVLQDLGDKLGAAAHQTIDAYLEKVPNLTADQLITAQDKLLARLGYGTSKGNGAGNGVTVNIQNNHVTKDVLEEARNRIGTHKVGEASGPTALQDQSTHEGIEIEGTLVREESELRTNGEIRNSELHSESMVPVPATEQEV